MAGTVVADKWENGDGSENYKCRAWVNFNGTGTVAIRASGNVSSITDEGTGIYSINLTNPMPDTNYCISGSGNLDFQAHQLARAISATPFSTSVVYIDTWAAASTPVRGDIAVVSIAIFR